MSQARNAVDSGAAAIICKKELPPFPNCGTQMPHYNRTNVAQGLGCRCHNWAHEVGGMPQWADCGSKCATTEQMWHVCVHDIDTTHQIPSEAESGRHCNSLIPMCMCTCL